MCIFPYEKLLPSDPINQQSIVYEICQPNSLRYQREAIVSFFVNFCTEDKWLKTSAKFQNFNFWNKEDGQLWKIDAVKRQISARPTGKINVASETIRFRKASHYSNKVYISQVNENTKLVLENDNTAVFMYHKTQLTENTKLIWDVSKFCSINIRNLSRYKILERFFNSWKNDENEVLSKKSEAHQSITLREFISAGNLRTGICLQFVRLFNCIAQRSLSFEKEEIVSLFMWTLFQVGPREPLPITDAPNSNRNWRRQSCKILQDLSFATDMIDQCDDLLDSNAQTWSNHNTLLNIVLIVKCILEHIDQNIKLFKAWKLLDKARDILCSWVNQLIEAENQSVSDEEKQHYRNKLVDVAIIGTLSYEKSPSALTLSDDYICQWIYFRAIAYENISQPIRLIPAWRRCHILHAQSIADSLSSVLLNFVAKSTNCLDLFLQKFWSGARSEKYLDTQWNKMNKSKDGWYTSSLKVGSRDVELHLNIINGRFLADKESSNRLPKSITRHTLYQQIFGNEVLKVQSCGDGRFKTSISIIGSYFEFQETAKNGFPAIFEIGKDGKRLRAIPNDLFISPDDVYDLPTELILDYSHWMEKEDNGDIKIHFRPIKLWDEDVQSSGNGSFILNLNDKTVHNKFDQMLLDINSKSFKELAKVFTGMTSERAINVLVPNTDDDACGNPIIYLPKLRNIKFELVNKSRLVSKEYKGMIVSENQNFGSLIGLNNGLLLSSSDHEDRVFICPHGSISRNTDGTVEIDVSDLGSPSFYTYYLRSDLWDIRAEKERLSWEYLALLHACTSGVLPDPFSRRLGLASGNNLA